MKHDLVRLVRGLLVFALAAPLSGCRKGPSDALVANQKDLRRPPEEWLRQEPVRLLRDYVRIETTDARGEWEGALFLRDLLDCPGIETQIVCPAPKRCNVLARLPGRSASGALLLLNHIDVVDAYPDYWKKAAPFEGKIELGYLYGRGSYDMKSIGLAQALALCALKRDGIVPENDILFLAEADEEGGQKWGSRWLLDHRPEWFSGVAAVLNEGGTDEMILREVRFWGIETLQAGYGLIEFESRDKARLEALASRWPKLAGSAVEPHPHVVEGFDMLANHLSYPLTDPLRHLDRVARDPRELAILPDRYGSFLEPRIHWTVGYAYPPGGPGVYRGYVVISTPPGVEPKTFFDRIEKDAAGSQVRVVSRFSTGPTSASPYPTSLTELLRRVTQARYPGVPFGPVPTFGGSTTSLYFRARGIPAYGYSPVPANIADAGRRHGNDERIYLRDYLDGLDVYRALVLEFAAGSGNKTSPRRTSD